MAGQGRARKGLVARVLPEKRVFIQCGDHTRYLRFSPLSQLLMGAAALLTTGWLVLATAEVTVDRIAADAAAPAGTYVLRDAYEARLNALTEERDQRAAEALSAQERFKVAMGQISRQQTALLEAVEERRELAGALDMMRSRLQDAVQQRDSVAAANEELLAQMSAVSERLDGGASSKDLADTLRALTGALNAAVIARDAGAAERDVLATELAALEAEMETNARRQDEMLADLEQAIALSFGPLETLFADTGLDVDSLLASVRSNYSGQGGPLEPVTLSTRSYEESAIDSRLDTLLIDLDRLNLLRVAAGLVPYAMPVKAAHRFTSGFGYRRDPKGGGRRMHSGADFAAPSGTPIYATADGVVKSAQRESGYGNTVRIEHAFGFETVYAHQSQLRVKAGQRVSRGEHIGDMGSTGRSTGVHLHYEVRLNGKPVNPMTYVEAAKHVF
jgi:murein DD-endopeptidase MepM/ murein hydrolase activator NlpD